MAAPTRGAATTTSALDVQWTAITTSPQDGGSTILSYNLQWDSGTNGATWTDLIGNAPPSLSTSMTVTTNVTVGITYQFRVRAYNQYGWGVFSSVGNI